MAGKNDRAIANALQALAQSMNNNNRTGVAPNWLEQFQRNYPPTFKGGYDRYAAMNWLTEIEKIFNVMDCPLAQKVKLATFMLIADAHFWWEGALWRMIDGGVHLNWDNFKKAFLEKYFPDDVRSRKEMEFLELNQGKDIVTEYDAKFDALVRYCTHYHGEGGERAKCIKFVNGLRPKVKTAINYQEIYHFPTLVNKCNIYDRDNRDRAAFYKGVGGPIRVVNSSTSGKSKPYSAHTRFQGSKAAANKSKSFTRGSTISATGSVGGSVSTPSVRCGKCGLADHNQSECRDREVTCFNYNGHISTQYPEPRRTHVIGSDFDLVVETPTNGPVTTSLVCLKCPLTVSDKQFLVDLICLPLSQLDVILGMDWLSSHHVLLNCFEKSISFGECKSTEFLSAADIKTCLKDNEKVYMILASLTLETDSKLDEIPLVREFPEVFPKDVSSLPPEREIEFSIDLVPGVGRALKSRKLTPRFIGPYQILKRIGEVAYQIALPPSLSNLYSVFHVSQLRKYVHDPSHIIESDNIQLKDNLIYETIPLRIDDTRVKQLRGKEIPLVKIVWGGNFEESATWELESKMR
ncbi:uncharacterized protein LOC109816383 [Cajanus cajan]|uniref:uncharacterized protein LOC109816383 n=1 Tax=Cajanus cajan TaxID=3821 RepID=UPI00098DD591|nr:uncharacterized protein LOC109816383 [Cajanus cajan]